MRKVIFMLAVVLSTLFVSCTKEREIIVVVPNVEVQLNMKQYFNVEEDNLFRSATTRSAYVHKYPETYTAYFVVNGDQDGYKDGHLIEPITVTEGLQKVVVPALNYKVYVTNFSRSEAPIWYTYSDPIAQMPQGTNTLYLYGMSKIDYSTKEYGEVEVKNPYAAVMIQNDRIPDAPIHYDSNTNYIPTGDCWWLKYIRNNNTNTGIVVKFTHGDKVVTIKDSIEANMIYKYTLSDGADAEGNFKVDVEYFKETEDRNIKVW